MKKYKFLLILLTLFLSSCGLEVPQPIPRLYSPNGVKVLNVRSGAGVPASTLRVTWYGLNPELEFSGYNIYYTADRADALAYRGTKILNRQFLPRQSTCIVFRPFNVARSFHYDITKFYYASTPGLEGELFTQGSEYWFWVTALNQVRNLESPPSRYAKVVFFDNLIP